MKNVLLIFIRNPELGKVKTRLARLAGDAEALRIYRILLDKTRRAALEADALRLLFYSESPPASGDDWPPEHFLKFRQTPGDLGVRMAAAFRQAFEAGAEKVLIVGSDCPELDGATLMLAFQALDGSDFVLGPSTDGGYYLLGMKRFEAVVFSGIAWSTSAVLEQTMERIKGTGNSCALLPELSDIDEWEDWTRYLHKHPAEGKTYD